MLFLPLSLKRLTSFFLQPCVLIWLPLSSPFLFCFDCSIRYFGFGVVLLGMFHVFVTSAYAVRTDGLTLALRDAWELNSAGQRHEQPWLQQTYCQLKYHMHPTERYAHHRH